MDFLWNKEKEAFIPIFPPHACSIFLFSPATTTTTRLGSRRRPKLTFFVVWRLSGGEECVSKEWAGSIAPPRQSEGHERYGQNLSLIIFLFAPLNLSSNFAVLCLVIWRLNRTS